MGAEKAILCVLFEEFSEPDNRYRYVFNRLLQITLDVTVKGVARPFLGGL